MSENELDNLGPVVVVLGSIQGGFQFYGPFDTAKEAVHWFQTKTLEGAIGGSASIALLREPVDMTDDWGEV